MQNRYIIELNADFKPKLIKHRRDFMANLISALAGNEDEQKKLLEYGVKFLNQRGDGEDVTLTVGGEVVYKVT